MSYYKPTTFFQKIIKLLQLYSYFLRMPFVQKRIHRNQKHTSILIVVSKLDRIGGLEIRALELSAALIHHGCLITILTDRIDDSPALEFRSGFVIRRLTHSSKPLILFMNLGWFLFTRRRAFQIVHAHGVTGFTLISMALAALFGRPVLLKGATKEDFSNILNRKDFKHSLYGRWIRSANRLIALTQEIKEEMLACKISENRIVKIPNGIDSEKFSHATAAQKISLRNKFSIETDQLVFLYLGRLEARKAVDVLLNAWHLKSPGLLCIVGSGPEQEKWKQLSKELNLKSIRFYAESGSPLEFYQCADMFVLPSLKEGMPGTLLEAMSCGLPCIATKIGGIVDAMQDGKQGLLVSPGSVRELADALEYAALHPEKRIAWGNESRDTILRNFEVSQIASIYNSLYKQLLSAPTD